MEPGKCPGKLNPADDASRGLKPQKLTVQCHWWKGPEYLWESEENWPEAEIGEVSQNDANFGMNCKFIQSRLKTLTLQFTQKLHTLATGLFTR